MDYTIRPVPRDDNEWRMANLGVEAFVERIPVGLDAIDLQFALDCKGVYIYNEGPADLTLTGLDVDGNRLAGAIIPLSDSAIIDNGDGTMNVTTLVNHGFTVGDNVVIQGRSNDSIVGTYAVGLGSATSNLVLLADWTVDLATTPGVDNHDGTVTLETDGDHQIAVGGFVTIAGRSGAAYAGTYTTAAGTATDQLIITVAYVDESSGVAVGGTVTGVYDESAGVADAGDVAGIHSATLVASAGLFLPIVREARSPFARVISSGTSTLSIYVYR